jgi:hypothetical protein
LSSRVFTSIVVSIALTIETRPSADQIAFNLKQWNEIVADEELAHLPHGIEDQIAMRIFP